jgi:hypothetical protein
VILRKIHGKRRRALVEERIQQRPDERGDGVLAIVANKRRVHANYAQLAGYASANSIKLGDEIRAHMWLSHYQDYVPSGRDMYGNKVDWEAEVKKDGFAGLVKVGMTFSV